MMPLTLTTTSTLPDHGVPAMRPSLLVVDDDPGTCSLLQRVLTRHGYRVTTVADGDAALIAMAAEPPALVLTDLVMPGLSGLALIDHLRQHDPLLPIIALSAALDLPDLGTIPLLIKPFSLGDLLALVEQQLPDER